MSWRTPPHNEGTKQFMLPLRLLSVCICTSSNRGVRPRGLLRPASHATWEFGPAHSDFSCLVTATDSSRITVLKLLRYYACNLMQNVSMVSRTLQPRSHATWEFCPADFSCLVAASDSSRIAVWDLLCIAPASHAKCECSRGFLIARHGSLALQTFGFASWHPRFAQRRVESLVNVLTSAGLLVQLLPAAAK